MVLKSVMIDIRSKQAQIISRASKSFLLKHKEKLEVVTAFQSSYSDRVWDLAKGILNDELDKVCGAIVVLMADSESRFLEKENRRVLCHFEQLAENVVPKSLPLGFKIGRIIFHYFLLNYFYKKAVQRYNCTKLNKVLKISRLN